MARLSKAKRLAQAQQDRLPVGAARDVFELLEVAANRGESPVRRIQAARAARLAIDVLERDGWDAARSAGQTWGELAAELGMTRSGAQQRAASLRRDDR